MFCNKGILKSFAKFTGKHLCQGLFLNKIADRTKNYISQVLVYHGKLKNQTNIIFPSPFWLKKDHIFNLSKRSKQGLFSNQCISSFHQLFSSKKTVFLHSQNVQNKNFSATSKYISINFLVKKDRIFHSRKVQNKNISIDFLAQKRPIFYLRKIQNKNFLVISKHVILC